MILVKIFLALTLLTADAPLTNYDVRDLVEKGLPENLIVTMINNAETNFDTSIATILKLREAGIPDKVLEVMINKEGEKGYDPSSDNDLLVYVTDSQSWSMTGGLASGTKGGSRPQTAEIIKTFGDRCPEVLITNERTKADYIVLIDHEGGKGWARKDNKVVVFNHSGTSLHSGSTRSVGNSVKDACKAIRDAERH
jgi:hypothetical protein